MTVSGTVHPNPPAPLGNSYPLARPRERWEQLPEMGRHQESGGAAEPVSRQPDERSWPVAGCLIGKKRQQTGS